MTQEDFKFPGIVPFCIETQKTRQQINDQAANGDSFVGNLYPIGLNLKTFTDLYWRIKKINASYTSYVSLGSNCPIIVDDRITSPHEESDSQNLTTLEILKKRTCFKPISFISKNAYSFGQQRNCINSSSTYDSDNISVFIGGYGWNPQVDLPKTIAEFNGGDRNNMNNYTYYPYLYFMFPGGYYSRNVVSFERSYNQSNSYSSINVNVSIGGENVGNINAYYFNAIQEPRQINFNTIDIELCPALQNSV